jgi:flagellar motor switch protein FliG
LSKRHESIIRFQVLFLGCLLSLCVFGTVASGSARQILLESNVDQNAKQKIQSILDRFCNQSCEILDVKSVVEETSVDLGEPGFESLNEPSASDAQVTALSVTLQIDEKVSLADRNRLGQLIQNSLRSLSPLVTVQWSSIRYPQLGKDIDLDLEDRMKSQLTQKIESAVSGILQQHCPDGCVLGHVWVAGKAVTNEEARLLNEREIFRDPSSTSALRVQNAQVEVSFDEKMDPVQRDRITNLIKAKTRFVTPITILQSVADFPEQSSSPRTTSRARDLQLENDPWNLDRLRQTLQIFRDLAGTKEIITNSTTSSNSNLSSELKSTSQESREMSQVSKEKSNTSSSSSDRSSTEKDSSTIEASKDGSMAESTTYLLYVGAFLIVAMLMAFMVMRYGRATKDAKIMLEMASQSSPSIDANGGQTGRESANQMTQMGNHGATHGMGQFGYVQGIASRIPNSESVTLRLKIENLRDEILQMFTDNPKVARDVFTRMIREDGVELTSKYVQIFGSLVAFELMKDPGLKRQIYELSEFVHKSTFSLTEEMHLDYLKILKTRMIASEIKVMTSVHTDQFDFLQGLDPTQVFLLIKDEKAQVQSIVLSQIDPVRRRAVYDLYEGHSKVTLMKELCAASAIPRDYLANVAKALHKKTLARTDFDTEQLRSSDILFDLLERAPLSEQRSLMADLVRTNRDAARAIKLKLVTVEMLGFLKDGHLLEIVMGLERETLLSFLVGAPEHVRNLLLRKAPSDLASSWIEDIEQVSGVDESTYRFAEMKICNRISTLANSGAIRLLDINERIFSEEYLELARSTQDQGIGTESRLNQSFAA